MATRVIRNDFVAGELSPALWGRQDQEVYFHGASLVENFVPMQTGGVRKRAGTEFVWHISQRNNCEYRIFPFLHNRDSWGLLALYREQSGSTVKCRFLSHRSDGLERETSEEAVPQLSLSSAEALSSIRCQQIGDTLFFTAVGHRAFKCAVLFSGPSLEWSEVVPNAKPPAAPSLNARPVNFHAEGDGYTAGSRTYRLWGVRDGVLSDATQTRADITLPWISGAYVDVTFQPNWAAHDYYILGKLLGGQYGEVSRFYPSRNAGARSDSIWGINGSNTSVIGGVQYTAAIGAGSADLWRTTDTEEVDASGRSRTGTFATSLLCEYTKDRMAPVLSILLWIGCRATNGTTGVAEPVGIGGNVTVTFRHRDGTAIGSWQVSGGYGDSSHTMQIVSPSPARPFDGRYGVYTIDFADEDGNPVALPVRGAILCSDSATLLFHDDNIQPGNVAGEQTALSVGDSGMDVGLISVWQQRLVAASSAGNPFTMWFSTIGDLYNFHTYRPQNADDAFEATLAVTRASRILHIATEKLFIVFTESGEFVVDSPGGAFSFSTINIRKCSGIGAHPSIPPVITEGDIIFVAQDARSLYQMRYRLDEDSVRPSMLSHRAAHLTERSGIRAIAYQAFPNSVLWCLLDDGTFASLTFVPDENVCAWARHSMAGGGGLVAEDIFATGSIRSDGGTDTTSDVFIVLRDPDRPGDCWVERMRPCVVSDAPSLEQARCADHMGYGEEDFPSGGNPEADVSARIATLRLDHQGADAIGMQTNTYDSVLRVRRSGVVAVRPYGAESIAWSRSAETVAESGGSVSLLQKDLRIPPRAYQNRDNRLEIMSADSNPCEILSFEAAVHFGDTRRT